MLFERLEARLYLSVPHVSGASLRYVEEAFATNWLSTVGPNLVALDFAPGVHLLFKALLSGSNAVWKDCPPS
ncbi:MAG: pyridoxal phosphate-dependent aminotransferase EpsN [Verrucomicrobiales bacterium]|jgi:pyridoxal phosphate-dependent aminotransferase EpsN